MPRSVVHLLLSLVLLVSQQMALAHGLSHLRGAPQHPPTLQASDGPDAPALNEFCVECAADAQLDLALPLPDYRFDLPEPTAAAPHPHRPEDVRAQMRRQYQPRAPPRAI